MTASPRDYAEIYRRFQAPLSKIYDCGKKCAPLNGGQPVCCEVDHAIPIVEDTEWKLLKSRTDMWKPFKPRDAAQRKEVADLKGTDCSAIECNGAAFCERDNRSLACRSFPFYPYFDPDKQLVGMAHYWAFEGLCWVISNLTIVEKPFIDQFLVSHEYLFKKDNAWRETYIDQSAMMRRIYSRRGERFPVIGREGGYFWVLPKSGGQRVPAKKTELFELRSGFPNGL